MASIVRAGLGEMVFETVEQAKETKHANIFYNKLRLVVYIKERCRES